ncbi:MAG TPA: class I SAM-dependent methyltransferase [Chitinophagales bacterium]|nr:class I SAM-dependent methyltransferase [Chitinophagales bacterium]
MEGFRPVNNTPPDSFAGKIKFYGRMVLDLQILTIYRDIVKTIPTFKGNVLDVGCGQSPYKFLLNAAETKYYGIDIVDAEKFDYNNTDVTPFNGEDIPFEDGKFDGMICTEVLEHVQHYQKLIDEMHRVMKPGATGIVTIPWSARYHYAPYDFFRYTPSSLKTMFSKFSEAKITNRGTDIPNIANKLIVMWFRNMIPNAAWRLLFVPIWVALLPILGVVVALAHIALWFNLGTDEDPLGYTIIVKK